MSVSMKPTVEQPDMKADGTNEHFQFDQSSEDSYLKDSRKHYACISNPKDLKERDRAVVELTTLSWLGGEVVQKFLGDVNIFQLFADTLNSPTESLGSKLKIMQCLTVACRRHKENQLALQRLNFLAIFIKFLSHDYTEMKLWTCQALFFFLLNNANTQTAAIGHKPELLPLLMSMTTVSWPDTTYNDAKEILKMMEWAPPEIMNEPDPEELQQQNEEESAELDVGSSPKDKEKKDFGSDKDLQKKGESKHGKDQSNSNLHPSASASSMKQSAFSSPLSSSSSPKAAHSRVPSKAPISPSSSMSTMAKEKDTKEQKAEKAG